MPFNDTMETMLPGAGDGSIPGITGAYGEERGSTTHGGIDFNYRTAAGGRSAVNDDHPSVFSPIAGTITAVGGNYNKVVILDNDGNTHEILHLNTTNVIISRPLKMI